MVNVVNRSSARQGFNLSNGDRIFFEPGQGRDVDDEALIAKLKKSGLFAIEGYSPTPTIRERNESARVTEPTASDNGPLLDRISSLEADYASLANDLEAERTTSAAATTRVGELETQLAAANEELEQLRGVEQGFVAKLQGVLTSGEGPLAGRSLEGLKSTHRGRGSYSVVNGAEEEVVEKLTKEQADAFDAMTPVDQLVWIDAQYSPPKTAEKTEKTTE